MSIGRVSGEAGNQRGISFHEGEHHARHHRVKPQPIKEPVQRVPPAPIKNPPISIDPIDTPITQINAERPPTLLGPPIRVLPQPEPVVPVIPDGNIFLGPPVKAPLEGEISGSGVSQEVDPSTVPVDQTPLSIIA
jgi:hypothetical protein